MRDVSCRGSGGLAERCAIVLFAVAVTCSAGSAAERHWLWEGDAPHAQGKEVGDRPFLDIYLPQRAANQTAVVVCPGGGYGGLADDHEGQQIARYFNQFGVAAFVLHYRLGSRGYRHPVPLLDVQRAVRTVRHHAQRWNIVTHRVGVMGFSAGGHLASTLATHFDTGDSAAADPVDRQSCRPDFAILCYPVITMTDPFTHRGSRRNLLGEKPSAELVRALSNETQVTAQTPPTFLFHTTEDRAVQPENSLLFYSALRKHQVPVEMHVYQNGPHGVGLFLGDPVLSTWSQHLHDWLRNSGFLADGERAAVSGTLRVAGAPVSWGTVSFRPLDSNRPHVTARVRNGRFALTESNGPYVGKYKTVVRATTADFPQRAAQVSEVEFAGDAVYTVKPKDNKLMLDFPLP